MPITEVPQVIVEWVKSHPILAAVSAVILLGVIVAFAVRYGNLRGRWP